MACKYLLCHYLCEMLLFFGELNYEFCQILGIASIGRRRKLKMSVHTLRMPKLKVTEPFKRLLPQRPDGIHIRFTHSCFHSIHFPSIQDIQPKAFFHSGFRIVFNEPGSKSKQLRNEPVDMRSRFIWRRFVNKYSLDKSISRSIYVQLAVPGALIKSLYISRVYHSLIKHARKSNRKSHKILRFMKSIRWYRERLAIIKNNEWAENQSELN